MTGSRPWEPPGHNRSVHAVNKDRELAAASAERLPGAGGGGRGGCRSTRAAVSLPTCRREELLRLPPPPPPPPRRQTKVRNWPPRHTHTHTLIRQSPGPRPTLSRGAVPEGKGGEEGRPRHRHAAHRRSMSGDGAMRTGVLHPRLLSAVLHP